MKERLRLQTTQPATTIVARKRLETVTRCAPLHSALYSPLEIDERQARLDSHNSASHITSLNPTPTPTPNTPPTPSLPCCAIRERGQARMMPPQQSRRAERGADQKRQTTVDARTEWSVGRWRRVRKGREEDQILGTNNLTYLHKFGCAHSQRFLLPVLCKGLGLQPHATPVSIVVQLEVDERSGRRRGGKRRGGER